ncbi:NAD-dependent epimerase/dehydratase family protein [Paenibacillus sp. GCM10012307]|uniref:NAD-dependent epimerase/dehydratase family protein n=1 Tax=Paenibacillus roseus TaxID=2798579 RepID=A0A934MR43_9BACL|nr:NAD-dependent epimerase/dehydratase family protein [Paenibacillus roseus]
MKILVTGSRGFIGKNLIAELKNRGYQNILEYHKDTDQELLVEYTKCCDFVCHLAGVNRPESDEQFYEGNSGFTSQLVNLLKENGKNTPVLFTSSIQVGRDNAYGKSKKLAEEVVFQYGHDTKTNVFVYRLPNIFGKWCRPNYNSVVATFVHKIARDEEIVIHDAEAKLNLAYIVDVVEEFIKVIEGKVDSVSDVIDLPVTKCIKVGELAEKIQLFKANRDTLKMPSLEDKFDRALYATYLSYLEENNFSYKLNKKVDNRGWLAEFIKSDSMGQIFVSKTKPGISRGNHWHHTKVEKFLVLQGKAVIRFRQINSEKIIEYKVDGETPEVVDIPVGYTHSIENLGEEDLITLFWACEVFDPARPDTYWLEV